MQLLPKRMLVAYTVAAQAGIGDLLYKQAFRTQEDSNFECLTSPIAAFHNVPTQDREVQMIQH